MCRSNSGVRTRFVVFRDAFGDDPVAVIVGTPDLSKPVPVRIHSACLTGDVFGSRRCDCGDQLKLALARLQEAGGGIILYLAQEGRGLGLANKMRTYKLQDAGLDTVDANTTLGFDDDERDYGVAVRMLQMLGCTRVVLLTNNPAKLDGLAKAGIEIAGRMPLETPINADNRRYLTAKAARAGHQLGHVMAALAEATESEEVGRAPRSRPDSGVALRRWIRGDDVLLGYGGEAPTYTRDRPRAALGHRGAGPRDDPDRPRHGQLQSRADRRRRSTTSIVPSAQCSFHSCSCGSLTV